MFLAYLLALVIALTGMVVLDRKFKLFFWDSPRRATIITVVGLAFFIVWDVLGITTGIFFSGRSPFMSGLYLGPEFPVEEVLFLLLLIYSTMDVYGAAVKLLARRGGRA